MARLIVLSLVFAGCAANPITAPDLPLADRFEMVAFGIHNGSTRNDLWKWSWPIRVRVTGDQSYHQHVADQLGLLGELTGLTTEMDSDRPNMVVDFSLREERSWCRYFLDHTTSRYSARISIRTDQPPSEIRRCIVQEMTQPLGLLNDLDGRTDTNFTSYGRIIEFTESDRLLLEILYDRRLLDRMPREEAMPIVRQIVAEMEAEQEAASQ